MSYKALGSLKTYKPTSPGMRHRISINRTGLHKGSSFSPLTSALKKTGYRNHFGRKTIDGRSGVNQKRRKYRQIDIYRTFMDGIPGTVVRLEYDPNRTSWIALIKYDVTGIDTKRFAHVPKYLAYDQKNNCIHGYVLASDGLNVGNTVISDTSYNINFSNSCTTTLAAMPLGKFVHNVQFRPGGKSAMARAAGTFVTLVGKECGQAILKLSSGETRKVSDQCRGTIGIVSNINNHLVNYGKAGNARRNSRASTTRGIERNPVDHHNGGRTHGGKIFCNFKGNMRKGLKTRSKKKYSNKLIITRRKRKGDK